MIKKLLLSFVFCGALLGIAPVQANQLADATKELNTNLGTFDTKNNKYKRSDSREMAEQLLLAFYYGGKNSDGGSFDTIKGATAARDGLYKVTSDVALNGATLELLKKIKPGLKDAVYKRLYRVWARVGFDFVLRGIKYANGNAQDKSMSAYVKNEFLPNALKKISVYWALLGLSEGTVSMLEKSPMGKDIVALYRATYLIPFLGIIIEDGAENLLEALYDKNLPKVKAAIAAARAKLPSVSIQAEFSATPVTPAVA